MKILIADDDFIIRQVLKERLSPYGNCDTVTDGNEALLAFRKAWADDAPYDLICLDIIMPDLDGHEALQEIRRLEENLDVPQSDEVKVLMISALDDPRNVMRAYAKGGATSYLTKPIDQEALVQELHKMGLIN